MSLSITCDNCGCTFSRRPSRGVWAHNFCCQAFASRGIRSTALREVFWDEARAVDLFRAGKSLRAIAAAVGTNHHCIANRLRLFGLR